MQTSLYRYFGHDGQLLYIGVSVAPMVRERQHRKAKDMTMVQYIELEWFDTEKEAYRAELLAIERERPLWNVLHVAAPRSVRKTILSTSGTGPVPMLDTRPPVLTGVLRGRFFACGLEEEKAEDRIFENDDAGISRAIKICRKGDTLLLSSPNGLASEYCTAATRDGVHICLPNA